MDSEGEIVGIQTQWCVVTGAPCAGKTTVLLELEKIGFRYIPEFARVFVERELAKGRSLNDIRVDEAAFQSSLIPFKTSIERALDKNEVIFLDRALPDSITFYRVAGADPTVIFKECQRYRYRHVFIFDRLPGELDHVRVENERTLRFLDRQLELDYRALGYDVQRIPVMSVIDRVQFILNSLDETGEGFKTRCR